MSENYQLVYQSSRKDEIYRDTGVSKNKKKEACPRQHVCLCTLNHM